jgi:16S rRNA (cytosine1402-N4)-methyltransferase
MHIPVLQKEVIYYLNPKSNENFIDCTIGKGGHTLTILEKNGPDGKVLGIDQDEENLEDTRQRIQTTKYKNRLILTCDNFANLREIVEKTEFSLVNGVLLDIGMCSSHIDESGKGFTFLKDEPLDMRYSLENSLTAGKIVNKYHKSKIEKILREYGEERFSKRIVEQIIKTRKRKPIRTTFQLREIIKEATPLWYRQKKIDLATKTFQALRIAVNNELDNLRVVLPQAIDVLKPDGRLAVISFHSLEDRIVKNFFNENKDYLEVLTKKPIQASAEEVMINTRSRSAKLRAVRLIKNN